MTDPVAFLGLGLMGAPMARRLRNSGASLRVWNRSLSKLDPAFQEISAATPAAAAADAAFVCVCVTDARAVEDVVFGAGGVAETADAQTLLIDFSTIGPTPTRAFAERLRTACGAHWIDAPVSGGAPGAQNGTLSVMCGGAPADVERAAPVFAAVAQRVTRVGDVGAGQSAKLCNQLIVSSALFAIAEAIKTGEALGLDVSQLPEALRGGFADSLPLQIFGPRMAGAPAEPKLGAVATMAKDASLIAATAEAAGLHLPAFSAVAAAYEAACQSGLADEDLSAITGMIHASH